MPGMPKELPKPLPKPRRVLVAEFVPPVSGHALSQALQGYAMGGHPGIGGGVEVEPSVDRDGLMRLAIYVYRWDEA